MVANARERKFVVIAIKVPGELAAAAAREKRTPSLELQSKIPLGENFPLLLLLLLLGAAKAKTQQSLKLAKTEKGENKHLAACIGEKSF